MSEKKENQNSPPKDKPPRKPEPRKHPYKRKPLPMDLPHEYNKHTHTFDFKPTHKHEWSHETYRSHPEHRYDDHHHESHGDLRQRNAHADSTWSANINPFARGDKKINHSHRIEADTHQSLRSYTGGSLSVQPGRHGDIEHTFY